MIENSIERQEKSSRVTELGQVFFDGKHENIKLMDEYGLPIPETCILGLGFDEEKLQEWIDRNSNSDILLRTSKIGDERGSFSNRDSDEVDLGINNLSKFVSLDQAVILQALPKESIDHDCMSGICKLSNEKKPYFKEWEIACHPDIASLTNRIGLSSWWLVKLKGLNVEDINKPPGNREVLLEAIKYRVGRGLLKKRGVILPKLEDNDVEYKNKNWVKAVKYCKEHLNELSKDHALILLNKRIKEEGLENLMPNIDDIETLTKLYPRFRKVAKYLYQSQRNRYRFSFGVKFSILEYEGKEKQLLCWDLIKGA